MRKSRIAQMRHILVIIFFLLPVLSSLAQIRGLDIVAKAIAGENALIGRQIAVFIAIDRYREWLPLKKPVSDALALKEILTRKYFLDDTLELYNEDATRVGIIKLFERLIEDTRPDDSVFLFYAGHGHVDKLTETGAWIPQDAGTDAYDQRNWLPNSQIRVLISKMKARHVVLVSDSCFSGDILNINRSASPTINSDYFKNAFSRRSRQVLSSGASETVSDDSLFSRTLMRTLDENNEPYLDPYMLFSNIRLTVTDTTPLLGNLKDTEYQEGGSFIFFLKDTKGIQGVQPTPASYKPIQSFGSVKVEAPSDVTVKLQSQDFSTEFRGGTIVDNVPVGMYQVIVRGPGYLDAISTLEVTNAKTVSWRPFSVGRLNLETEPEDSTCVLESPMIVSLFAGTTDLTPGSYGLRVSHEGYQDFVKTVTIAPGRILAVKASLDRFFPGSVRFPSYPVDITISADGSVINPGMIPSGIDFSFEVKSPQAISLAVKPQTVRLKEGEFREISLPTGRFSLPYVPEGSLLKIGERELEMSIPAISLGYYESPEIPAGEYEISFSGPLSFTKKVVITEGKKIELPGYRDALLKDLSEKKNGLQKKIEAIPGKRSSGWVSFMTGVLGAAGGAASYLLGLQAMDTYKTSLDPAVIASARNQVNLFNTLVPAAAAIGGIGFLMTPIFWSDSNDKALKDSIQALDQSILRLKKF